MDIKTQKLNVSDKYVTMLRVKFEKNMYRNEQLNVLIAITSYLTNI